MWWTDPSFLFAAAGQVILFLWLALVASLWLGVLQPGIDRFTRIGVPVVIGSIYTALLVTGLPSSNGGFGNLGDLRSLFSSDRLLLAGWLHYLAFDYFVGGWIARDARARPIHRGLVAPCLILCFLAGPTGLLVYLLLRQGATRAATVASTPR